MTLPDWQWNEIQQVGTDYADLAEVEAYDNRMATVRDVDAENREIMALLRLAPGATILEIGCGTGRFARMAASLGVIATAIDVSPIMLEFVREKAKEEQLPEIATQHAGFLTMAFPPETFDAAVSSAALHHLPDAWKLAALRNVATLLKPGGQFILCDVVFSLREDESPEAYFKKFANAFPPLRAAVARHIAQEFSTYDWIMEGLLERAGFTIALKKPFHGAFSIYHCLKK